SNTAGRDLSMLALLLLVLRSRCQIAKPRDQWNCCGRACWGHRQPFAPHASYISEAYFRPVAAISFLRRVRERGLATRRHASIIHFSKPPRDHVRQHSDYHFFDSFEAWGPCPRLYNRAGNGSPLLG